jgi:hypothetical protein
LILYQGNAFVIYYAPNTYSFTRLGKIDNVTRDELIAALGSGNVTVTLELPDSSTANIENLEDSGIFRYIPIPASDYITVSGEFEQLTLLNTNGVTVAETKENTISIAEFPKGVYLLRIDAGKRKTVVKKVFINSKI